MRFTLLLLLPVTLAFGADNPPNSTAPDAHLSIEKGAAPRATLLTPASRENAIVYKEPGRYGGWPANHGLWQWGDELVVGFTSTWYQQTTTDHRIDRTKPSYEYQARSLDGGHTWRTESELPFAEPGKEAKPQPLAEPLDFTAPNFALMFRFGSLHAGPSWFYTTTDRCKTWQGPYSFGVEGINRICTRTDLIVLGPKDCLMFGSCAKQNDGKEGRVFCARTTDGGLSWKLVSLIGDEPVEGGYAIMPSSLRLKDGSFLTIIRRSDPKVSGFLEAWRSEDLGVSWKFLGKPVTAIGGNPPALVQLQDGRVAVTYGFRHKPSGMRACVSADGGRTWGGEIALREDAFDGDLGYPRSIVRPDGKVLTVYYYNGPRDDDRAIEATQWTPPAAAAASVAPIAPSGLVAVDRVRFLPAPDREQAMVGGRFTGSNVSATEGYQLLAEIKTAPAPKTWTELKLNNSTPYRWVRYEAPAASRGNIAELEFYAGDTRPKGHFFGSAGLQSPGGPWKAAIDEKPQSWVNSSSPDGQYVGLDLEEQASTAKPVVKPNGGEWDQPQTVTMTCPTPGAAIRYTTDGTTPTLRTGQPYTAPFTIDNDTTLVAVAFKEGLAPSPGTVAIPWIGRTKRPPINSFHVGNSLTGNASRYRSFLRSAGRRDDFPAYMIGGSLTVRLWNDSHGADQARWDETYARAVHPLEYFTLQPRDFNVAEEADYATRFIQLLREKSPDVQPWLYAEWVELERQRPTDKGIVPSYQMEKTFPALTWEESMSAMVLYNEQVRHEIAGRLHEGKPVRVLPTALAMGWVRRLIDQGNFPGVAPGETNFYQLLFEDKVHVNPSGCYLVALTWYAALHRESPEGKLLPIFTSLTAEQATVLQRLAWDVIKNYPDCGLYEEGSEHCGPPMFIRSEKTIELRSSTPGAWFRYTLDGTAPTRTNGYIYCGMISQQPGIQVKAIAYKSGMADSDISQWAAPAAP